jgi:hypothetical protein
MKFLLKNQARVSLARVDQAHAGVTKRTFYFERVRMDGELLQQPLSARWIWTQAAFHSREAHAGARVARVRPPESEVAGQVAFKMYAASLARSFGKVSGFCLICTAERDSCPTYTSMRVL